MVVHYHDSKFPPSRSLDWSRLARLIGPANAAVAKFDGLLHAMPDTNVLLSPLITQEAVLSSRIEGTQATIGEVLEFEAEAGDSAPKAPEKEADIQEVLNYRRALQHAVNAMETLPLSQRVIREAHGVLMTGVRGMNKSPGEYRRTPNWIGPEGCTRLLRVSSHDDWTGWCEFFLKGVLTQGARNEARAKAILDLYRKHLSGLGELTNSANALKAVDWFFQRPIFKTSDFVRSSGLSKPTATRMLAQARAGGMLQELRPASGRRPALLALTELLDIAENKDWS